MGLFDMDMPLLYGKGEKAFTRLQEEIMRHSDDQSLFAWISLSATEHIRGLLATSPAEFVDSSDIYNFRIPDTGVRVSLTGRWHHDMPKS